MRKILVWGTGKIARQVLDNGLQGEVIGFIETEKRKNIFMNLPVYNPEEAPEEADVIVIANTFSDEIYQLCLQEKINLEKTIFIVKGRWTEANKNAEELKDILGERNYIQYQISYGIKKNTFVDDDAKVYAKLNKRKNFDIREQYMWPIIGDKYNTAGKMNNYFWQDLWAARLITRSGIKYHFDIGSRLDGFIAHLLAADIDVTMIDIREFPGQVECLHTIVDDATSLRQIQDESIESMSALCSLEHFGLGRYGDPVDPEACFKCFGNIQRKLARGGKLYISLPIGKERVEFNAHRVFYASTVVECFQSLQLKEFSCVADGKIEYNVDIHKYDNDSHNGEYRYGLFRFVKI